MRLLQILICSLTLSFFASGMAVAQQASWQGGSFKPIVAQSSITDTESATLQLIGLMEHSNTTAPYNFEWRKDSPTGKVVSKGSINNPVVDPNRTEKNTTLTVKQPGTYYLVMFDASSLKQRVVTRHQVAKLVPRQ